MNTTTCCYLCQCSVWLTGNLIYICLSQCACDIISIVLSHYYACLFWYMYCQNFFFSYKPDQATTEENKYFVYGVTATEAELDVLTGQYQINRVDILYDCGERLVHVPTMAEVVKWLTPWQLCVRLLVRSRPRACFKRHYLWLELSHAKTWILSKSPDWQTKHSLSERLYRGVPCINNIKMAKSTMVIPHQKQYCLQYTNA